MQTKKKVLVPIYVFYHLKPVCCRYFHYFENVVEWTVLILVIFSLLPNYFIKFDTSQQVQKHLAAFTFLLAFMQVTWVFPLLL